MTDAGDSFLLNRAESAEAKFGTLKANMDAVIDRVKQFKANFGIRERSDGSIIIDFEKMVDRLGPAACLELRTIIDDKYNISGAAGEKPRMKVKAA